MKDHIFKFALILSITVFTNLHSQLCEPEYNSGSSIFYIEQYKIGDYSQGYNGTFFADYGDPEYHDRSNITIDVMDSVPFDVEIKTYYSSDVAIYIDLNNNDEFTNDELLDQVVMEYDTSRHRVTLLLEGITGARKMRIRTVNDAAGFAIDACYAYDNGMTVDHTLNIQAYEPQQPVAHFNTRSGLTQFGANDPIVFQDSSEWKPTSWLWKFEGGIPSQSGSKNPAVIYKEPGCYKVSLTAKNAQGSNTIEKDCYITIDKYCYPSDTSEALADVDNYINAFTLGQINNDNANAQGDQQYTYFANSSTNLSINTEYTMSITAGADAWSMAAWIDFDQDGVFETSERILAEDYIFTYPIDVAFTVPENAKAGQTRLRLRSINWLSDDDATSVTGCSDGTDGETEDYNVNINLLIPNPNFSADTTWLSHEDSVDFHDASNNQTNSWLWTFEGGVPATSEEKNPTSVKFPEPGTYTVSLTAGNDAGSNTNTKTDYITVEYVKSAMFSASETTIETGNAVDFTDESDNEPISWTWYIDSVPFYQSEIPAQKNPSDVFFNNVGEYDITLVVDGLADSKLSRTKKGYIKVIQGTGIDAIENQVISIFPNPNNGTFALFIDQLASKQSELFIQDIQGRIILHEMLEGQSVRKSYQLNDLDAGIYVITVKSKYQTFTQKLQIH